MARMSTRVLALLTSLAIVPLLLGCATMPTAAPQSTTVAASTTIPQPTRTFAPPPTPTATPIVHVVTSGEEAAGCPAIEPAAEPTVDVLSPFCVVWPDEFDDERGFRVHLDYTPSGERFVYEVGPDVTRLAVPEEDMPRLTESAEQCRRRNAYTVQVVALRPDIEWRVGSIAANIECGAAGEFVERGAINFLGEPLTRWALVHDGLDRAIHYNEAREIVRGDLVFTIALVSDRAYERGAVVPEGVQAEADRILETVEIY